MSGDATTRPRQDHGSEAKHVPSERENGLRRGIYDTAISMVRRNGVMVTGEVDRYIQDSIMAIDLSELVAVYGQFSISGGNVRERIVEYAQRIASSVPNTEPQANTENGVDG
jgi:hypothetical protein